MNFTQHIELPGWFAPESEGDYCFDYIPPSLMLYCHLCGVVWCRMRVNGARNWTTIAHLCECCGDGSLLTLNCRYRDFKIPDELLFRELSRYYERTFHEQKESWV